MSAIKLAAAEIAETPAAIEPRRKSRPVVVLATIVATALGGSWWTVREYGSMAGLRQRVSGARVVIANPLIELGVTKVGEARDFAFRVRNCSAQPVTLLGVRLTCGCMTTVKLPVVVPAGAWHEIAGTLKATAGGRQERPLEIYTDHPTAGIVPCVVALVGLANSG